MKIEVIKPAEPKSSYEIVEMIKGLQERAYTDVIDHLKIMYRIDGHVYEYGLTKK